MHRRHVLEGLAGQVGEYLSLHEYGSGRWQVRVREGRPQGVEPVHWKQFTDAVAYALATQNRPEYVRLAAQHHTTPFKVATADFLHSPQIVEIDLSHYTGQADQTIRIVADDEIMVTEVGVLVLDPENRLIEMGLADRGDGDTWIYRTKRTAPTSHVRVVVDASDLPGHLSEGRSEKDL